MLMTHSLRPGNPSLPTLTGIKMSIEMYMNIYFSTVYRKKKNEKHLTEINKGRAT